MLFSKVSPSVRPPWKYRATTRCLPGPGWLWSCIPTPWHRKLRPPEWGSHCHRGTPASPVSPPQAVMSHRSSGTYPRRARPARRPQPPWRALRRAPTLRGARVGREPGAGVRQGGGLLGVLLPVAPAVPEPPPGCPAPPSSHLLCFLLPLFSFPLSLLLPLLPFHTFFFSLSFSLSLLSFALHSSAPPGPSPSTPSLLHPSLSSFKPQPVPCSCLPVPLPLAPHSSVLHAWGPCPPHSWGAGCPLPVLVPLLWGPFGGWGR